MSTTHELLNDEEYLKIQKLNSAGSDRRNSIIHDIVKDSADSEIQNPSAETSMNVLQKEEPVIALVSSEASKGLRNRTEAPTVAVNEEDVIPPIITINDEDAKTFAKITPIDSKQRRINVQIAKLNGKERSRFHRDSKKLISFFDDVDFDVRPTIIDGAISEPYLATFDGPVMERQVKAFEKMKKAHENSTKLHFESNFSGIYVMLWMVLGLSLIHI